jgi:hypothetical protein|tara:strand:- start:1009 stop:1221 length:213 start_codon:yes stop_codon:yes gene_type:complete
LKTDEEILEEALERFAKEAREKFMAGIREHNPDGSRGMSRMTMEQKLRSCREEVMDLWFYLHTMERECRE